MALEERSLSGALAGSPGHDQPRGGPRKRRALTPGEAARLIQAAESGPVVLGMSGHDRAMAYRVALSTGLRADEPRSLTPESFRLDANPPAIVCEAGYKKNGRRAEQPIPGAMTALLRPWAASLAPSRVFKLRRPAEMLRAELLGLAQRGAILPPACS